MALDYSKIITTVNSVTQNISIIPDQHNVIVIDTSDNRLGINTINPQHSIDVRDNPDISGIIHGDHIKTRTVMSDLTPDIDICYNLGSQTNRWNRIDASYLEVTGINIKDATKFSIGEGSSENGITFPLNVNVNGDIAANDLVVDGINIRDSSKFIIGGGSGNNSGIEFPTNIDISKNLIVNGNSEFIGNVSVKDDTNDLILIDKTNPNIILINLQENQQVKINGKLLVTGEIDNDYLIELIQGQSSSIQITNSEIINKTHFYTLYDGSSLFDPTLDITSNDVSFNTYKSLSDVSCGFNDDYTNYNGYNIFFTNQSYDNIKLISNTRKHLSYYNQLDISSNNFSVVYNNGSENFYEIYNNTIKVLETDSNYKIKLNIGINVDFKQKIKGDNYYIDVALMKFNDNSLNDYIPNYIVEQKKNDITLNTDTQVFYYEFELNNQIIQAGSRYGLGFLIYVEDTIYSDDISGINNYYNNQYFIDNSNNINTIYDKTIHSFYKERTSSERKLIDRTQLIIANYYNGPFNWFYSKYDNITKLTNYTINKGFHENIYDVNIGTGYFGFNLYIQYDTSDPYDNIEDLEYYDLIDLCNNNFFTNLETPTDNRIAANNYKLQINESGRYLINFRIIGRFRFTTGIQKNPYTFYGEMPNIPEGGDITKTYYGGRSQVVNIALLKNVDTDISLIKTIDGDDIFYSVKGEEDNAGGEIDDPLDYDFSKNCYIDLSKNDTISIGMLHKLRGGTTSHNWELTRQASRIGGINEPYIHHGGKYYTIVLGLAIDYSIYGGNHFSIIKVVQDFELDLNIPTNSIDYKIQKASDKNFTEINIENKLTLNDNAIFKAKNIDFSEIPTSSADVSLGYLYQDSSGFIKIKTS